MQFIHGKKEGIDKLVEGFKELFPNFAKSQIKKKILEISDKSKHPDGYGSSRFMVKRDLFDKLALQVLERSVWQAFG